MSALGEEQSKNPQSGGGDPLPGENSGQNPLSVDGGRRRRRGARKSNPWLAHVKETMKKNRGVSFKNVLKIAKRSFKSKSKSQSKSQSTSQSQAQSTSRSQSQSTSRSQSQSRSNTDSKSNSSSRSESASSLSSSR